MTYSPRRTHLQLEHLPTASLIPNSRNARRHSRTQINKLARIIDKLGFSVPIVIDETGVILAGHGRLEAAVKPGLTEVTCIRLMDLSEAEKLAFSVADNRVGDESTFDDAAIKGLLIELTDLKFDTSLTGFEVGEIDFRIDGAAGADLGDAADRPPAGLSHAGPVSRTGELWFLRDHRLFCGSALDPSSYVTLLDGELAQMAFTDSPTNLKTQGYVSGLEHHKHLKFTQAPGELSIAPSHDDILTLAHALMAAHSIDGSIHFACIDWRSVATLINSCANIYHEVKNICVWINSSGGLRSLYRSQHEFVVVFKKGTAAHINNIELGSHGRGRANVFDYPGANSFGPTRKAGLKNHLTVKPVALVADAIRDCSKRGGLILDPFSGSGTTIVASELTGRRAAAIEIEPALVDFAIRRWQTLTGLGAVRASDGQTFLQIQQSLKASSLLQRSAAGGAA